MVIEFDCFHVECDPSLNGNKADCQINRFIEEYDVLEKSMTIGSITKKSGLFSAEPNDIADLIWRLGNMKVDIGSFETDDGIDNPLRATLKALCDSPKVIHMTRENKNTWGTQIPTSITTFSRDISGRYTWVRNFVAEMFDLRSAIHEDTRCTVSIKTQND